MNALKNKSLLLLSVIVVASDPALQEARGQLVDANGVGGVAHPFKETGVLSNAFIQQILAQSEKRPALLERDLSK